MLKIGEVESKFIAKLFLVGEGIAFKLHYKKKDQIERLVNFTSKLYPYRKKATVVYRDLAMNYKEASSLISKQIKTSGLSYSSVKTIVIVTTKFSKGE